jgi:cardiolipin synthase
LTWIEHLWALLALPRFRLALTLVSLCVSAAATVHVLLKKRETRSAIGWIGLIWLSPFLGTGLYLLLGINRIRRQARRLRKKAARKGRNRGVPTSVVPLRDLEAGASPETRHMLPVARLAQTLVNRPLWTGNTVAPLDGGDQLYPAMVRAIDQAESSVSLLTYIFYPDAAGTPVIEALSRAVGRGVAVRVLIDDVGSRYGFTSAVRPLHRAGVPVARFNPSLRPSWVQYANLRNHRKLMVVDGRHGFTGGMNILADYMPSTNPKSPKRDLHFEVHGPIVADLQRTFAADWAFCTGEDLDGESWFPDLHAEADGAILARGIADGPDDDADRIALTLMGALACAQRSVSILTPYFVPEGPMLTALGVAALRGVEVDLLVPLENNHRVVHWAMLGQIEPLLESGVRVWLTPPPFDHTKLVVVDGLWTMLGSANWDARSFVLNFEYVLECYDEHLATRMGDVVASRLRGAERLTLEDLRSRPLPARLRDATARLLTPYL